MTSDEMRQHLEMLLADSEARHKDIELLYESVSELRQTVTQIAEATKTNSGKIDALLEVTQGLTRITSDLVQIAKSHEARISTIEGGPA